MTVGELIDALKAFDENDIVVIVGGDGVDPEGGDFHVLGNVVGNINYDCGDIGAPEDGFDGEPCVALWPEGSEDDEDDEGDEG